MCAYSIDSSQLSGRPAIDDRLRRLRGWLIAGAAVALLFAGHAAAQEAADADSAQASAPTKPGRNGKVCQLEDVTGSRMKKRVCYTPEQWEAREADAKAMVRELDGKSIPKDANGG